MIRIAVLDAATLGEDLDLSPLNSLGEVAVYQNTLPGEVAGRLDGADVVMLNKIKLNESNLSAVKSLKLICIAATGYDNVDVKYCRGRGIAVCNVAGYSTDSVCQVTLAMALDLATHIPEYTRYVRDGLYSKNGVANRLSPPYRELSGKTWGVVGYGNIGKKVASVASAIGCRVVVFKRTPVEGCECVDIDTLCRVSDIISLHTPLNEGTRNLISRERIALMKKDVIVINAARGAVADEKALADAVREGRIGALGADVYTVEPFPENHPYYEIRNYDNVCLTPHMAWGSVEARNRLLHEMMENIKAFYAGEKRSRVN